MENASAAFLDAVRKSMRPIRAGIGAKVINPTLLTTAERLQYEGYLWREDTNAAILALAKDGVPIQQIVKRTGHSRKLVRQVIRVIGQTCSAPGNPPWRLICPCSMRSGRLVVTTTLSCGAV